MVKVGSTPVLNAVSVFLMIGSGSLALLSVFLQREKKLRPSAVAPWRFPGPTRR
jgi:hypothetical protein